MIYMDKAILERRLHLTVTFIGGFMGCYAIFNRCDVFGSAQTGNLISFVMDLTGHSDPHMFFRFSALLIYILAMVATVFLSHKLQKTTLKFVSLLIDALAFLFLGFLPEDMDPFIALYPVFFATAFQWCSFKGADGFNSSCIFCTNNLRQCTTGFAEYLYSKDSEALRRGIFYGKVLLSFYLGVAVCFLFCQRFHLTGAWAGLLPVCAALVLVNEERVLSREKETEKEEVLRIHA